MDRQDGISREARRVVDAWRRGWPRNAAAPRISQDEWDALKSAVRRRALLVPRPVRSAEWNADCPEYATVVALYERLRPTTRNVRSSLPEEERVLRALAGGFGANTSARTT